MRDFEHSTLWPVSEYERAAAGGTSVFTPLGRNTTLSTSLIGELRRIVTDRHTGRDVLEVVAACMRLREPVLLLLAHQQLVWPLTLFPDRDRVHSPSDFLAATVQGLDGLKLLAVEPPGVRPPGDWRNDLETERAHYRPLAPLLWRLALRGPRAQLLNEIGGSVTYRAVQREGEALVAPGALGPAVTRLRGGPATLTEMAHWPGLSTERASRLLNALYLNGRLMVLRSTSAARPGWPGWLARRR